MCEMRRKALLINWLILTCLLFCGCADSALNNATQSNGITQSHRQDPDYVRNALLNAMVRNDVTKVKQLLANEVDKTIIDAENIHGVTPLIWAARKGYVEIVQLLIKQGADVNHKDQQGNTPLHLAAKRIDIFQILLAAGADYDIANNFGYTALINNAGSNNGSLELARLLVENGADINSVTQDGQTAFKLSCQTGKADVATYLYEKGASVNFEDISLEGMELNGTIQHILGDYFCALDNLDRARLSYEKAREYYGKLVDKYSGDVSKIAWEQLGEQFGKILLLSLAETSLSYASSYQANMQSRQFAEISTMKHAKKNHTGIQGYHNYMTKYKQDYVPTYQGTNISPFIVPSVSAPLNRRRVYANAKAEHYEGLVALIDKVLGCFDNNQDKAELHGCISGLIDQGKKVIY